MALGAGLPAPKNIIADPKTGVITPEWLSWLQDIANETARLAAIPRPPEGGGGAGGGAGGGGAAGGGGPTTIFNNYGSGTPGFITKWLAPQQLGDSLMQESGGAILVNGPVIATSFQGTLPLHALTHQAGGTDVIDITLLGGYPGGTSLFLRADGTFALPPGGGGGGGTPDPHASTHETGGSDPITALDASVLTSGTVAPDRIAADSISYDKLANLPESTLLGRGQGSGAGDPQPITLGAGLVLTGTVLSAVGGGATEVWVGPAEPVGEEYVLWYDTDAPKSEALKVLAGGVWIHAAMNLDYLGSYTDGPVYYDGDIVIGPDNVAYMCVVDGTTAPPEPWPGVGVATAVGPAGPTGPPGTDAAIIADATYWTVSAHPQLVNERALNALANGYVKSTVGEPSTVAVIPVADGGTGATTASAARTNLGVGNVGTLNLSGSASTYLRGDGVWVTPATIPSGMIALFLTACPVGWTRMAGWDGRFPRGNVPEGAGGMAGSTQHYHLAGNLWSPAHAHGASGLTMPGHNHGGTVGISGTTGSAGGHSHSFGVHTTTGSSNQGTLGSDTGSDINTTPNHQHNINFEGTTGSVGDHAHAFSASGSIPSDGGQGINGVTADSAALAVFGNTDWATDHYPPFVDVVYCMKD